MSAVLALAAASAPGEDVPPPVRLRDAVAAKTVTATARAATSWRLVDLTLENTTDAPLRVDVAGAMLESSQLSECVRIGLGPTQTKDLPGMAIVALEPKKPLTLRVPGCALDSGRPLAPKEAELVVSKDAAPGAAEKALRWWAEHPAVPVDDVAEAVWKRDPFVRWDDPAKPKPEPERGASASKDKPKRPWGRLAWQYAGILYRLEAGELTSVDAGGVERYLATGIWRVIANADGVFVFATELGDDKSIWRLPADGAAPVRLAMLRSWTEDPFDVATAGVAGVLVTIGMRSQVYRAGEGQSLCLGDANGHFGDNAWSEFSMRSEPGGRLLLVSSFDGTIDGRPEFGAALFEFRVAPHEQKRVARFKDVRSVTIGPAGVYAVSPSGTLLRAAAAPWSLASFAAGKKWAGVLGVATGVVWAYWRENEQVDLVCIDVKSGKEKFRTRPDAVGRWSLDEATGDLFRATPDGYQRLRAADGKIVELPPPR